MPLYEFAIEDEATGETLATVNLERPVGRRDKVRLRRVTVPRSVAISGAVADPHTQRAGIQKALHRKEEREGSRFKSAFSKKTLRQVWGRKD